MRFSIHFHHENTSFSPKSRLKTLLLVNLEPVKHFFVFTPKKSPGFHQVLKIHQVFTKFWTFTRFSTRYGNFTRFSPSFENSPGFHAVPISKVHRMFVSYFTVSPVFTKIWILKCHQVCARSEKTKRASKMITCDLDVLPKYHIISISNPIEMLILILTISAFHIQPKISNWLLYGGTSWYHMVFTIQIILRSVKSAAFQWHVSSIELNMQLQNNLLQSYGAQCSTSLVKGSQSYALLRALPSIRRARSS